LSKELPVPVILPIHIIAASIGLMSGTIALTVRKGRTLHRRSGMVFVGAMCAMCGTALISAVARGQVINVMAALTTAYLVLTGLMTVRPPSSGSRRGDVALMLVALTLGTATTAAGLTAIASPDGKIFGFPSFPFFLFGLLGLSGGIGDWRVIRSGALRGAPRLARHLWRMCMALFIAAASFFSIRTRVAAIFPVALTTPAARAVPVLLVLATMCYWLWRIRSRTIPARA
jgi:uncharacterized membrane protein